jgi:hypothetical protein
MTPLFRAPRGRLGLQFRLRLPPLLGFEREAPRFLGASPFFALANEPLPLDGPPRFHLRYPLGFLFLPTVLILQPALAKEIDEAEAFVLLVGENGLGPWQTLEYYEARDKLVKLPQFPVVLLLPDGHAAPGLPFLRQLHWIVSAGAAHRRRGWRWGTARQTNSSQRLIRLNRRNFDERDHCRGTRARLPSVRGATILRFALIMQN